jgi:hypothetical protein
VSPVWVSSRHFVVGAESPLWGQLGPSKCSRPTGRAGRELNSNWDTTRATFRLTIGIYSATSPPIPSPEGALSGPPGPRGEGAAPAPVGTRQAKSPAGNGPDRPGGLLPHPSGTTTGAPSRLKKCGMETFRRRVGAPVRRDFILQRLVRRSLTPRPVPASTSGRRTARGRKQDERHGVTRCGETCWRP